MKLSVAIPTYRRPEYLKKAFFSVLAQTRRPDEILIISRIDDVATNEAITQLSSCVGRDLIVRNPQVTIPGFLPPVICAIDEAHGDILVLLDDDAVAHPDWLMRIEGYYRDAKIGGVGGRCINYSNGILQVYPPVTRVGNISWYGRSIGNMYRDCVFGGPVDVKFLMGGNMSYRLNLFRRCKPDKRIGNNVAFHWEVDVAQQVRNLGFRIIFDPNIKVDHHTAPREIDGMRTVNYEGVYWSNFNYSLLMKKHLPLVNLFAYIFYSLVVGGGSSPGLIYIVYSIFRGNPVSWRNDLLASLRGRFDGLRA